MKKRQTGRVGAVEAEFFNGLLANTREVQKPKRARKPKPAKATAKAETPVRKELKMGSLDHLI
ncbi:hypothetical protein, partial [Pseudomonas aeruginosa]|uniref:hypothetical protein n=1 Tax=Pseudomonas aeruginosa TaxID=287 RepID=UPI002FDF7845